MVIGLCDDNAVWLEDAEKIIKIYAKNAELDDVSVKCFENANELLTYEGLPLDVLFLDIELQAVNGIELGEQLNQRWKQLQLIYLTNYMKYSFDAYKTEHVYFVLKEQFADRIADVFLKVLHNMEQSRKSLSFDVVGGGTVLLAPEEVLYFERQKRVTKIATAWGSYIIKEKLNEIEKQVSDVDFVRCHNSYLVYIPAVRQMQKDMFQMNNGDEIVISRSYSKAVKIAFTKWAMQQGG